jgi:hypothetical protein
MTKQKYIILVAYDSCGCELCENNMVCVDIVDTRAEAREVERQYRNLKNVEFVQVYSADKLKPLKK